MNRTSHSLVAFAWLAALASTGVGCLCPPCPGTAAAGPEAAAGANPAAPVAVGAKLMIWDGDDVGTGAQSWDSCEPEGKCEKKTAAEPGVGINGSVGLKFHAKGSGFLGMGWNIFGWYPANAGIDLTPYSHLSFQIRADVKSNGPTPDPGFTTVLLGCSANKYDSESVPVEKYAKGFADGKWHKVTIPLSAFTKGKGAKFDAHSFWEFRLGTWAGAPRMFDIYIDDIAAEKL